MEIENKNLGESKTKRIIAKIFGLIFVIIGNYLIILVCGEIASLILKTNINFRPLIIILGVITSLIFLFLGAFIGIVVGKFKRKTFFILDTILFLSLLMVDILFL